MIPKKTRTSSHFGVYSYQTDWHDLQQCYYLLCTNLTNQRHLTVCGHGYVGGRQKLQLLKCLNPWSLCIYECIMRRKGSFLDECSDSLHHFVQLTTHWFLWCKHILGRIRLRWFHLEKHDLVNVSLKENCCKVWKELCKPFVMRHGMMV